ncbi:hypothetical protein HPHPH29_0231 [Helicobacter pylori Hp H-29]|nr:hypothetical protein HPHPH29_0231 [Helicobacter pylori Hp H-29]
MRVKSWILENKCAPKTTSQSQKTPINPNYKKLYATMKAL